ncbi:MAG: type II toxin-antitoxin system VapC family toxin [Treponema sp.]|jgi:PIN domain nuclease of toxin-antitoxin system|nr:type II toxin-antitoxin system VapC family toxin [Treponema sp.]
MNSILDACALLAFLNDEEGADVVESLLNQAASGETVVFMSIVNLLEAYYGELRDKGAETARIVLDAVQYHSIKIIENISQTFFHEAARLKAAHKMSFADAIGLAIAIELSGQFVTSDHHELEEVERQESISFLWLPPKPKK